MKYIALISFLISVHMSSLSAQEAVAAEPLYGTHKIPFSKFAHDELDEYNAPRIYAYDKSDKLTEDLVFLIIPGGGYAHVAMQHEGVDVARRLNENHIAAYVLYYRLPNDSLMTHRNYVPLQDALRALEIVHERHPTKRIAVLGFSAGGHLAATIANFQGDNIIQQKASERPRISYSILAYPVISMDEQVTHKGSKNNLIGTNATAELVAKYSMEKQVSKSTPPTFIMHAEDDKAVSVDNALLYIDALKKQKIEHVYYPYKVGGHGFGMNNKQEAGDWFEKMLSWIKNHES